ncbi:MAG: LuxR C-terminal-related transcriptional regulator [Phycisphaerales bacterium]
MTTTISRTPTRIPGTEGAFFAALVADSAASVMLVADDGTIEFANFAVGRLFGRAAEELIGQSYASLFDETGGRERMDILRDAVRLGEVITVDGMLKGRLVRCTYRQVPVAGGRARALIVSRAAQTAAEMEPAPAGRYFKAKSSDSGPLGLLTPRELEIMRLIGLGLSTAAIAKKLHRSVKTIEWHRVSLGTKLGVTNRVELARIAIAAGLVGVGEDSETEAKAAKAAT